MNAAILLKPYFIIHKMNLNLLCMRFDLTQTGRVPARPVFQSRIVPKMNPTEKNISLELAAGPSLWPHFYSYEGSADFSQVQFVLSFD